MKSLPWRLSDRIMLLGLVACLAYGTYGLWSDPVPYSLACFQPDRTARSLCNLSIEKFNLGEQLRLLRRADPRYLAAHKAKIVADYRRAFVQGLGMQNMPPLKLEWQIDSIINARLGQPI